MKTQALHILEKDLECFVKNRNSTTDHTLIYKQTFHQLSKAVDHCLVYCKLLLPISDLCAQKYTVREVPKICGVIDSSRALRWIIFARLRYADGDIWVDGSNIWVDGGDTPIR